MTICQNIQEFLKWFWNGGTIKYQEMQESLFGVHAVLDTLPRGRLPQGIEIQILDLGYEENFLKNKEVIRLVHQSWRW